MGLEVVLSFDTTGSMHKWLDGLRGKIQDLILRLQRDISGIKLAVMAHGDYCDADKYVTKWIDLTTDVEKLCDFVRTAEGTGGGDDPECYELVLRQTRTKFSWTQGSQRVLVMIGDAYPHEPDEECNKENINWKDETKQLSELGVTIYGVQCGRETKADEFFEAISNMTGGKHLYLEDLNSLFDTLVAVCYRESRATVMLTNLEKEVKSREGGAGRDITAVLTTLLASPKEEDKKINLKAACKSDYYSERKSEKWTEDKKMKKAASERDYYSKSKRKSVEWTKTDTHSRTFTVSASQKVNLHAENTLVIKSLDAKESNASYKEILELVLKEATLTSENILYLYRYQKPGRWYLLLSYRAQVKYYDRLHGAILHGRNGDLIIEHLDKERIRLELHWIPPTLTNEEVAEMLREVIDDDPDIEVQHLTGSADRRLMFVRMELVKELPQFINISIGDSDPCHVIQVCVPSKELQCPNCGFGK